MDFERVKSILACPECHSRLKFHDRTLICSRCDRSYPVNLIDRYVRFVSTFGDKAKNDPSNIRDYFKRWPGFYYFILKFFGPLWRSGINADKFLEKHGRDGVILNLGSGPKVINSKVINLDIFPYKGVSVVADAHSLPFKDNSIEAVICAEVLEHVKDPEVVINEINRVLTGSGSVYVSVPFLFPFHASPIDFRRWTHEGLKELLRKFEIIEIGVYAGPFSALTVWLSYIFSSIFSFGSTRLYWLLTNLSLLLFFPVKILDIIAARLPFAINSAAVLYVVARKK